MGKAAMCIQMLQILNSGRVYKCSELADLLETNPRNVIEYRKELEEAGYCIISIPGKYGGYQLDKSSIIPSLRLNGPEKVAFLEGVSYLKSRPDFPYGSEFSSATAKIVSSIERMPAEEEIDIVSTRSLSMPQEEIAERYKVISRCIKDKTVLKIRFLTNYNVERDRAIHPYKLFMMNNAWFVLALCESPRRIMPFKLNRILEYRETSKTFRVSVLYKEHEYFDEHGLKGSVDWAQYDGKHDREWYHVKLELHGRPAMYVKEYIYGKNQTVTPVNKNKTILECDIQYKYNTIQLVLGFGRDCVILEPQWLRDEICSIAKDMVKGNEQN